MTGTIQIPSKGDGLKAAWGASVANGLNALMPMAPARMLVREGAGGVGCEPLPKNLRDRKPAATVLPWTFRCTVGEDENGDETRTGGWCNGQAQLGLDAHWFGDYGITRTLSSSGRIEDCDQTEDGQYYLEVKPDAKEMTLKRYGLDAAAPQNDFENDTYYVYVGTVEDAKQTDGIYCVPVIYNYL